MSACTSREDLKRAVVPERAGRCTKCSNYYAAQSLVVIRVKRRWFCLHCAPASAAQAVAERRELLHGC